MATTSTAASPDDILAMLSSEFGTKKPLRTPAPKKVAGTSTDTAASRLAAENSEANRISKLMSLQSPWKPVALVAHVLEQECRCCGSITEILGNVLIRHQHRVTGALWDCVMPESPAHFRLPRELASTRQSVEQCPPCLRMEFRVSDLTAVTVRQRGLFQ